MRVAPLLFAFNNLREFNAPTDMAARRLHFGNVTML